MREKRQRKKKGRTKRRGGGQDEKEQEEDKVKKRGEGGEEEPRMAVQVPDGLSRPLGVLEQWMSTEGMLGVQRWGYLVLQEA